MTQVEQKSETLLKVVREGEAAFEPLVRTLELRGEADFARVEDACRAIVQDVQRRGDGAVAECIERFEKRSTPVLFRREYGGEAALSRLDASTRQALEVARNRIAAYHHHQLERGFRYEEGGVTLGSRVSPLARVGVYAPGGKARYPSSVLMAAVPAHVAGVRDIVVASPLSGDAADDLVLAAAHLSGVTGFVDAGGAHAVAALAYGTESIPRVAKIVGPGNIYVACAKKLVVGACAIDGIAGPSEILVVADDRARPDIVAADLLSQAEHDEAAYPLLICASVAFAQAVNEALSEQLRDLPKAEMARASLRNNGYALVVADAAAQAVVANRLAVEHVSLQVADDEAMLDAIPHAGAVFLGSMTPEAAGDYLAGPSHVLPTGGAARFGAPLGVYDFLVRTSVLRYGRDALGAQAADITRLARVEGLEAHARAVERRLR